MKEIEERLSKIGSCAIEIINDQQIQDAHLITFKCDGDMTSAAVVYNSGELFHLADWQSGYPCNVSEIADFEWLNEQNQDAIILNELPRML